LLAQARRLSLGLEGLGLKALGVLGKAVELLPGRGEFAGPLVAEALFAALV
jgi:hypothetical protein